MGITFDEATKDPVRGARLPRHRTVRFLEQPYTPAGGAGDLRPSTDPNDPTGQDKLTAYEAGATGTGKVYISYLQGLIEVVDPANFTNPSAPVAARFDVRRHPNRLVRDPTGTPGSFYIGNGGAGVARIRLP
jgi:hypothetical protein